MNNSTETVEHDTTRHADGMHSLHSANGARGSNGSSGTQQIPEHKQSTGTPLLTSAFDTVTRLATVYNMIRTFSVDGALGRVGLARRTSMMGSVTTFSAGVLVGAGSGLMLAPMSGSALRKQMLTSASHWWAGTKEHPENAITNLREAVHEGNSLTPSSVSASKIAAHAPPTILTDGHKTVGTKPVV